MYESMLLTSFKTMASKKKHIVIKEKDIKYRVTNTPLKVIISNDDKVYFDVDPADESALIAKDEEKIAEYQEKVKETMEYLFLEGFLENSDCEESDE